MKFSTDLVIAGIQRNCVNSRKAWMSSARVQKRGLISRHFAAFSNSATAAYIRECVRHARRCSRAAWQIAR